MTEYGTRAALAFAKENMNRHLDQLFDFLRIQSVSADPQRKEQMEEAADWLAGELRRIGVHDVEIVPTELHPVVLASTPVDEAKPTILLYGHYDVQPEDPVAEWKSPPFAPEIRNGAIYGRGSTDDKGQLFMHLKAVESYLATGDLPINVRFVLEGEEEIGSANLVKLLESRRATLDADLAVVSDTPMFDRDVPSIGYGLRGLCYVEVTLRGPTQDLHSGQFGGAVGNPANVLVELLGQLHDDKGKVTVPGFYDDVIEIDEEERDTIRRLPFTEELLRSQVGVPALHGESGFSTLERLWTRPTLDINGLFSGYQGPGAKTILPSAATAKLSCRLVPDQDYQVIARQLERHLIAMAPPSVQIQVDLIHGALPWVTSMESPAFAAAHSSLAAAFEIEPVNQRDGGSIPIVPQLERTLGVTTMLLGFGIPDENKHAPNEHLLISNYERGIVALIRLFGALGDIDHTEWRAQK